MRIDLNTIDTDNFKIKSKFIPEINEDLILIAPQLSGVNWNYSNLIYRSSIWNKDGILVSAGFPKFFNWGEMPDLSPPPTNLNQVKILDKFDGSLLIVSKYKGHYLIRTRKSFDIDAHENSAEVDVFKTRILPLLDNGEDTWNYSYLFEWISYSYKIIISYEDAPSFKLIGKVHHEDYSLATQDYLDSFAKIHNIDRPKVYSFNDTSELLNKVSSWDGSEGVIVYSNNDQTLHKVKSTWYLSLHRMKSDISSTEKVTLVWNSLGRPDYGTFYKYINDTFDYELAEYAKNDIKRITDANIQLNNVIEEINYLIPELSKDRKEAAKVIQQRYQNKLIQSIAFNTYSQKSINEELYLKALECFLLS